VSMLVPNHSSHPVLVLPTSRCGAPAPSTGGIRRLGTLTSVTAALALSLSGCTENYYRQQNVVEVPSASSDGAAPDAAPSATSIPPDASPSAPDADVVDSGLDASPTVPLDAASLDAAASDAQITDAMPSGDGAVALDGATQEPEEPLAPGVPGVTTSPKGLDLDPFGTFGNTYWFLANDRQIALMNAAVTASAGGGGGGWGYFNKTMYRPGAGSPTYFDHVVVTTAGEQPKTADFGKTDASLWRDDVGGTGRELTDANLPSFMLQFGTEGATAGLSGARFHNGLAGSIFREKLALDLFGALGYPTPRTNYAWVSTSEWAADVAVPYLLVEPYSSAFCEAAEQDLHGGCTNLWEASYTTVNGFDHPGTCLLEECDTSRGEALTEAIASLDEDTPVKAALSEWIDWDAFHQFQCANWILGASADPLRATSDVVVAERADGKFQYLPSNVELTLGASSLDQGNYYYGGGGALAGSPDTLGGTFGPLTTACQGDAECWADTISTCGALLDDLEAIDPVQKLDDIYALLDEAGMLRSGDDERYIELNEWLSTRVEERRALLAAFAQDPFYFACPADQMRCGSSCQYPQWCYLCQGNGYPGYDGGVIIVPPPKMVQAPGDIALPPGSGQAPPVPLGDGGTPQIPAECYQ
jgi:CotH kinase protein